MSKWTRNFRLDRTPRALAALVLAALSLGACDDDDPTDPDPVVWGAEVAGVGEYEDVTGVAAVVVGHSAFLAEIEIDDAPANAEFAWSISEGTCAAPGDRLGTAAAYPDLDVDATGAGDAEATVSALLDEDEDYIVLVTEKGTNPDVVACGALEHD